MTPEELVRAAGPKIGALGASYYFVPETLARAKELGLDGFRFYFLGRGGVLGDVEAPVVQSAFGYFEGRLLAKMWDSARRRVPPRDAGRAFLASGHDLGRRHFAGLEGLESFCAAGEAIVGAADPAAYALFAAAAAEPLPEDPPARAVQLLSVLRELRGSAHLVALVASGVSPRTAHYLRRPNDFALFGWGEEAPAVTDDDRARLAAADALTDRLVLPAYSAVDPAGAGALMAGLVAMESALA